MVDVGLTSLVGPGKFKYDRKNMTVAKFLNRIICVTHGLQKCLINYFADVLAGIVDQRESKSYDFGILDLGSRHEVKRKKLNSYLIRDLNGDVNVDLHTIELGKG